MNVTVFALSALLTAAFVPHVPIPSPSVNTPASFWSNTMFGVRFLRQQRLLLWLAGLVCLTNFLDAPLATVQLPALVREHYGSAERVGLRLAAFGLGAVGGIVIFSTIAPRPSRRRTFIASFFIVGSISLLTSTAPTYLLVLGAFVVAGHASSSTNPILMSIRQERVPLQYRARMFGTMRAIAFAAIPLGQLTGRYLIEWLGVQPFIALVAVIYLMITISFVFNPILREMDRKPNQASPPVSSADVITNP